VVSWSGHILPVAVTVAVWFLATGLVAWLDNRDRATFPRSLAWAGAGGVAGLVIVSISMAATSNAAVYAGFAGAMLVWGWLEVSFLTGAMTGPRRLPCPPGASRLRRFADATATLVHHEIALAVTALLLLSLTWNAPNQIAAMTFVLLYAMRMSTKLNIFHGVPNAATDILPPHLAYLTSYYGPNRLGLPLVLSILGAIALAGWLTAQALAAPSGSAEGIGASLLAALAALGVIEHLLLALPVRDGALWGWALPRAAANSGRGN
jgi:putative photosynthetic complex assembly protein 2